MQNELFMFAVCCEIKVICQVEILDRAQAYRNIFSAILLEIWLVKNFHVASISQQECSNSGVAKYTQKKIRSGMGPIWSHY